MAKENKNHWPEFAIQLYEELTRRNAEISYNFNNFELLVPATVGATPTHAHWKFDGQLNVTTRDLHHGKP